MGAAVACLRKTATALVYSCAEYCCATWLNSAHAKKIDVELNGTMRLITGLIHSNRLVTSIKQHTATVYSPLECLARVIPENTWERRHPICIPTYHCQPLERLKSRKPPTIAARNLSHNEFDPKTVWKEIWARNGFTSQLFNIENHSS